ncbi:2,5-diketo-D-gluconate reductase-like protein A [Rhizodiscina lignyota]|uniref:2,5-diketo-D-gluconate reductase-like protein A n=1 Tax=Rhizodiscina lignyota TaxID=1504668 RepID=A0A9P4I3B9_9PEZI|nr:2,5-diketo-D-gluconate reductase-like protein A [Rhizodiscina lignyota]
MANIHTPIPLLKLNDGTSIPMLAYGTGTAWYKPPSVEESKIDRPTVEGVKTAIKLGYYHLDGAEVYKTEPELGLGIKESGVPRDQLYVVTKVNQNIADIHSAIRASLKKLQLDYVDLYLIHQPFFAEGSEAKLQEAWAAMEQVKADGLAKSIGVSNYYQSDLEATLATAKVVPAINQIEFHPYLQHGGLLEFHRKHGIATSAYGPLTPATRSKGGPVDEYLGSLAKKYAVTEGEILLRWCVDQDVVTITTSGKEQRLSDYLRSMTFKLTPTEVKEIKDLGEQKHFRAFWQNKFAADDKS